MPVQALDRFAESHMLYLPDEFDGVTVSAASVTNVPTGTGVRRQVRPPAVEMKWAAAGEGGTRAAKLNPVLSDEVNDWMLLAQQLSVDAGRA